jgi:hypothetical protein
MGTYAVIPQLELKTVIVDRTLCLNNEVILKIACIRPQRPVQGTISIYYKRSFSIFAHHEGNSIWKE